MKWPVITEQQLLWIASALIVLGYFLNLGVQPLYLEEPRRILIALEMFENGQYIAPTELGDFYYKKPPVFNWILMLSASIFGRTEWAFRLPTVLSTLGMGFMIWWIGRKYLSDKAAWITALLFISTSGIFFYFSLLAEIDLFYSLITLASFLCLFHFYQKQQYFSAFWLAYLFGAIGALTKGPPSVLFLGLTIPAYLLIKKDWKRLFSFAHISGGLLFLGIVGAFLYVYSFHHPLSRFLPGLWGQTSEMTVLEESSKLKVIKHFFTFPFTILADLLPGSILLLFALRKNFWQQVLKNELVLFSVIVFAVNIPVYLLSPGGRHRYIYMLYPFLLYLFVYFYNLYRTDKGWRWMGFRGIAGLILAVLPLGALALNFIPDLHFLPYLLPLSIISFLAFAGLFYWFYKIPRYSLLFLLIGLGMARIVFDLTVLPQRAYDSDAIRERQLAQQLLEIVGEEPVYILKKERISFTTTVYFDLLSGRTLRRSYEVQPDTYYLVHVRKHLSTIPKDAYESYMTIDYKGRPFELVRFNKGFLQ